MAAVLGFQVDQKVLLALLVGAVGLFVAWWRSVTSWEKFAGSYAKTLPPGKWGLPYVGEMIEFMFTQKYNHGQFVEKRKAMYGPLFRTHIFGEPVLIASGTEDVKLVLQSEGKLFHPAYPVEHTGRTSAPAIHGEEWKAWRRFALSKVGFLALKDRINAVEEFALTNLSTWEGRRVLVGEEARSFTFEIVAAALFSVLKPGKVLDALKHEMYTYTDGLYTSGKKFHEAQRARGKALQIIYQDILPMCGPNDINQFQEIQDVKKQEHPELNEAQLREVAEDYVHSILFAGHESATTTLTFAVKNLSENPDILRELKAEHDKIRENKPADEKLTWEEYKSMTFTQHVITESVRMSTPLNLLMREAKEDVKIYNYIVPKKWKVFTSLMSVHYDPVGFKEPLKFNPYRYMGPDAGKVPFMGFGNGPRICPGADLARLEVAVFLHHFVTKFTWETFGKREPVFLPMPHIKDNLPIEVKRIKA